MQANPDRDTAQNAPSRSTERCGSTVQQSHHALPSRALGTAHTNPSRKRPPRDPNGPPEDQKGVQFRTLDACPRRPGPGTHEQCAQKGPKDAKKEPKDAQKGPKGAEKDTQGSQTDHQRTRKEADWGPWKRDPGYPGLGHAISAPQSDQDGLKWKPNFRYWFLLMGACRHPKQLSMLRH